MNIAPAAVRGIVAIAACGCGRLNFTPLEEVATDASDPVDTPAATCTALLCDDFENGLAGWAGIEGDVSAVTITSMGRTGQGLHAVGTSGQVVAALFADVFDIAPAPADRWVRLYVFAPSGSVLDDEIVELSDADKTPELVFSLYDDSTDVHTHGLAPNAINATDMTVPRDVWSCYELHISIGTSGVIEAFREGALLDRAITDTTTSAYSRIYVGIASKPMTATSEVFVDDVIADVRRPGC